MRLALTNECRAGLAIGLCLIAGPGNSSFKALAQEPPPVIAIDALPPDAKAQALLRKMLLAENSLRLSGIQVTTVVDDGRTVTSEQRIERNGTKAMRTDYLNPPRMVGEVIVDNGTTYWHYIPAKNRLETGPSRLGHRREWLTHSREHLDRHSLTVQWSGHEKIAGHYCQIIDVQSPSEHGPRRRRFWIDQKNGAQLGIEQYDSRGERRSTTIYKEVNYNPVFSEKTFAAPLTPRDVQIVKHERDENFKSIAEARRRAGFPIFEPAYLPFGYSFQSGGINHFDGRKMVALRYVNGLTTLSLFETLSKEPAGDEDIKHPRPGVATKRHAGIRLVLVGNIEPAEADKILLSVR